MTLFVMVMKKQELPQLLVLGILLNGKQSKEKM